MKTPYGNGLKDQGAISQRPGLGAYWPFRPSILACET